MKSNIAEVINNDEIAYRIYSGQIFYFDVPGLYDKVYDFYKQHIVYRDHEVEPVNQLAEFLDEDLRKYFGSKESC